MIYVFLFVTLLLGVNNSQQISYKENLIDSPVLDILWCKDERRDEYTLIFLSQNGTIYTSDDNGFNVDDRSRDLEIETYKEFQVQNKQIGKIDQIIQSEADPSYIMFIGSKDVNFYSNDCGRIIQVFQFKHRVVEVQMHPTEPEWILIQAWNTCPKFKTSKKTTKTKDGRVVKVPPQKAKCADKQRLYLTQDRGKTFKMILDYVVQFSWYNYSLHNGNVFRGALDMTFITAGVQKERIVAVCDKEKVRRKKYENQQLFGWSDRVSLFSSNNFFKTKTEIVSNGNRFLLSEQFFFVAKAMDIKTQDSALVISQPRQKFYSFVQVDMPMKRFKEHSYTILDTSEGQVFIQVNHQNEDSRFGNIYISDAIGSKYSLSLENNVRNLDGQCDFVKIEGLEGIYIANVFDDEQIQTFKEMFSLASSQKISTLAKRHTRAQEQTQFTQDMLKYKQTLISFDKGGIWKPIEAPLFDSNRNKITCMDDECSLHLNSLSDMKFGPLYSPENALGILLSTGNVGYHLATQAPETNTYISRDGGKSWFEIKKGSHIFEIGDHGGLIILSEDQAKTDTVSFTWDEGLNFAEVKVSDKKFSVTNIVTDPENNSQKFLIYGQREEKRFGKMPKSKRNTATLKGVLVSLDFTTLHQRICQGIDKPDTDDSDYELWTPHGFSQCLMGHKSTYIRRKREAQCYNGEHFDRKTFQEDCVCTEEDWECDVGYQRSEDGPCIATDGLQQDFTPPKKCEGYYIVSQGYRKIAGDTCTGGVDHSQLKLPCPGILKIYTEKPSYFYSLLAIGAIIYLIYQGYLDNLLKVFLTVVQSKETNRQQLQQDNNYEKIDNEEMLNVENYFQQGDEEIQLEDHSSEENIDEDDDNSNDSDDSDDELAQKEAKRGALKLAAKKVPALKKKGKREENQNDYDDDHEAENLI